MASSQNHTRTFWIATTLASLAVFTLMGRLVWVTMTAGKTREYQDPVVSERVVRGTIYDRGGQILAIETPSYNLYFRLSQIKDMEAIAALVSPYIGMSVEEITRQVSRYQTYALVRRDIGESDAVALRNAVRQAGLSNAVDIDKRVSRTYPASFHASQTIGFVDTNNRGLEGIEYAQDANLSPLPLLGSPETSYGQDITLTLDIDVQYLLDLEMQRIAQEHLPDYAIGIVMDAKSGDILALSSYPWYDTNDIASSSETSRLNHAVNYLYEPGSVFKVFSLCAEMEIGQADLSTPFICDGSFTFDGITIGCHEPHGAVTPREMISLSCNGAVANWALQTDSKRFYGILDQLGFNRAYDIGLPSRSRARIADPSTWSARSKATISFGQEVSVTALHLAAAATALANGGSMLEPHLILKRSKGNETGNIGETLFQREITKSGQIFSEEVARKVLDYMHSATEVGGTARLAAVEGVNVSAKTGTAQLYNPETHSYKDGGNLASTLALVPTEDPEYIIYIAAGNPKGNTIWGANIAGPAVGKVVKGLVSQGKLASNVSPVL